MLEVLKWHCPVYSTHPLNTFLVLFSFMRSSPFSARDLEHVHPAQVMQSVHRMLQHGCAEVLAGGEPPQFKPGNGAPEPAVTVWGDFLKS